MIILGIETSCDETAVAVVKSGTKILSNVVASSVEIHAKTGGIIPETAARQQIKSIIPVLSEALRIASESSKSEYRNPKQYTNHKLQIVNKEKFNNLTMQEFIKNSVDAIAVTVGPGLIGSLLVGVETAKTLSYLWKKPLIPVNHLVAHIYANWTSQSTVNNLCSTNINKSASQRLKMKGRKVPEFPVIALVVSGGHTDLVLMSDHGKIKWLGGTRDDAAGEAFDKCARILQLPYPGGPSISKEADKFFSRSTKSETQSLNMFPRPMVDSNDLDFSFSGLKTSVFREVEKAKAAKQLNNKKIQQYSAEIQEAIVDVLIEKSILAIKKYKPKSYLTAGGVSANARLREKLPTKIELERLSVPFHVPVADLCTDNAVTVASCAHFNYIPIQWNKVVANPQLTISEK